MNPEEMELAYVSLWDKTAIASSRAGDLWGGYAGSSGGSGEANDKGGKEEDGQEEQANQLTDEPPPTLQPANRCVPTMGN